MEAADSRVVKREEEIANPRRSPSHFVLLGAGASKAAVPNGDRNGRRLPLLRDVATDLGLAAAFPDGLQELAVTDFEAAYSRLYERGRDLAAPIEDAIAGYFRELRLPDEANLYDTILLSLRTKDVVPASDVGDGGRDVEASLLPHRVHRL